ncbi:glycosyltransferase [Lacticaseibacillus baoqingensis]|uniref:Glycosyltransferase n=1 Tax=Lacticaseibacillus baoqingensis TaxID=2486013 RepID=A0ABW4E7I2_9LACO|nr:glycosyltransferase [Lacticaseibacillus baoqingensis]
MKISYTTVFFNNTIDQISKLVSNIENTVPPDFQYDYYLVNNSPDNTEITNHLQALSKRNQHIHSIIAKENRGFGAGNNLAISFLESDYHIIVNPDVTIPDKCQINMMIQYMHSHEVVLLSPLIKDKQGYIQKLVKRTPTILDMGLRFAGQSFFPQRQRWFTYDDQYGHIHESSNLPGSFLVFKTDTLKKIGGFDERYFLYMEDADIARSMALCGKTVFFPNAYIIHEWQRENKKSIKGILRMVVSMYRYFSKWGWKVF